MEAAKIYERLRAKFGESIGDADLEAKDPWVQVQTESIRDVCRYLNDDPDLSFDCLSNQSGVDYKNGGYIEDQEQGILIKKKLPANW